MTAPDAFAGITGITGGMLDANHVHARRDDLLQTAASNGLRCLPACPCQNALPVTLRKAAEVLIRA
jgi:hypothetical protein